jgi:rare lipoprotein A
MDHPTLRPGHEEGRCDRDSRHRRRAHVLLHHPRGGFLAAAVVSLVLATGAPAANARTVDATEPHSDAPVTGPVALARPVSLALLPTVVAAPPLPPVRRVPPKVSSARRGSPLRVVGPTYVGRASWYGPGFQGRRTANGERFDTQSLTAAHKSLPFGTRLRVCRGTRCVVVRVNDRGPYIRGRFLDLSGRAATAIGLAASGVSTVTATVVEIAPDGSTWKTTKK